MWGRDGRLKGGQQGSVVVNADLSVSAVTIDVGLRMEMLRFLNGGQQCGVEKKTYQWPERRSRSECRCSGVRGVQGCGVVDADLAVSAVTIDVG